MMISTATKTLNLSALFLLLPPCTTLFFAVLQSIPSCHAVVEIDLSKPLQTSIHNHDAVTNYSPGYYFLNGIFQAMRTTKYGNPKMEAVIVLEKGEIVYEKYRDHPDKAVNKTSEIFSATKNIMSMIIGRIIDDGLLSMGDTLGDIFDVTTVWDQLEDKAYLQPITIKSLLQMTSGLVPKRQSGLDPASFMNMYLYNYTSFQTLFDRPSGGKNLTDDLSIVTRGQHGAGQFSYLGSSNILSYVVKEKTGLSPREYFHKHFLVPLGISNDEIDWKTNADGIETSFSGLQLTARQMAKIGQFLLQGGKTGPSSSSSSSSSEGESGGGEQILSKEWIENATMLDLVHVPPEKKIDSFPSESKYGYLFWSLPDEGYYCAFGAFGHYICVHPSLERVYVQQVEDDYISLPPMSDFSGTFISQALHPSMSFKSQVNDCFLPENRLFGINSSD